MSMRRRVRWALPLCLCVTAACTAVQPDYAAYRQHLPHSILVLPPLNQSADVNAPYVYLSTVTRPLAECGYYVFPVALVDAFMKENGLPTPGEMHGVPLDKLRDVFGADAVLYVDVEEWGQKYVIISSTTIVRARARLVDAESGTELWSGTASASQNSAGAEGGPIAMAIAAVVEQIVDSMLDAARDVSRLANRTMMSDQRRGLLFGPYHPRWQSDARGR